MCNLNIIIQKTGKSGKDKREYANALLCATAHSFAGNNDADGLYLSSSQEVVKIHKGKINLMEYADKIDASEFIITHQRISTSGHNEEMDQPFANERWICAHNGIIHYAGADARGKSDTCIFFEKFNAYFEEDKTVKTAIERALKDSSGGSYSIFLFDKWNSEGYYFKSASTKISVYELDNKDIFITTDEDNAVFFKTAVEYEIDADTIYYFYIGKNVEIRKGNALEGLTVPVASILGTSPYNEGEWRARGYYRGGYMGGLGEYE